MLLRDIKENKLTGYFEEFGSWEDAIRACGQIMIKQAYIDERYVDAIIKCINDFGPYIVIMPDVAMPHSTLGAEGVYKTGIGFMKVNKPVSFDENDHEKDARLFFTLAATNNEEHLNNMMQLSELLMNEELVKDLLDVNNDEDLEKVINKYQ